MGITELFQRLTHREEKGTPGNVVSIVETGTWAKVIIQGTDDTVHEVTTPVETLHMSGIHESSPVILNNGKLKLNMPRRSPNTQ